MCIIDQHLNELMRVVQGVKRDGGYFCLPAHPAIQKAMRAAYSVGATVAQVKNAIEAAYIAESECK